MVANTLTPMDTETGIPFPILPSAELPPVPAIGARNVERLADLHHPFHPRAELVGATAGQQAVRDCRVQWALYDDHHRGYHTNYAGPQLPLTDDERFRTVVFAAAGFVPDRALAFDHHHRAWEVSIDDSERDMFRQSGQVRVGNRLSVSRFLTAYALRHEFAGVRESLVDELLHTNDETRRREIGRHLIAVAAHDAAWNIHGTYQRSRVGGLLPPTVARTAGKFVFRALTGRNGRLTMQILTEKLQAAA